MKRIKYQKDFMTADGQPFFIQDPDPAIVREARAKQLADLKTPIAMPTIEADFGQVITWLINGMPHGLERDATGKPVLDKDGRAQPNSRKLTPIDGGSGYAVIKAFRNAKNGYVELEDAVYTWLVDLNNSDGVEAFKPISTQGLVKERLEDLVIEEPKEELKKDK